MRDVVGLGAGPHLAGDEERDPGGAGGAEERDGVLGGALLRHAVHVPEGEVDEVGAVVGEPAGHLDGLVEVDAAGEAEVLGREAHTDGEGGRTGGAHGAGDVAEQAGAGPGLLAALISTAVDECAKILVMAGAEERTMLGLGGYGDLLASIALEDRPEVVLGKALARGQTLDQAVSEAKLRVEAIELIPRLSSFAKESKVPAVTFDALVDILKGQAPLGILERIFRA